MYKLPYAYAYALPDMRRITLVLMHILIQSSYKSIFSYKTSGDAETSDDAETHMEHSPLLLRSMEQENKLVIPIVASLNPCVSRDRVLP